MTEPAAPVRRVHHVGMTVTDVAAAVGFWEALLGIRARFAGSIGRPYLGESVGHPGVRMDAALLDLPGGVSLELLQYLVEPRPSLPDDTAHPGNVHLCLEVADAQEAWNRAVSLGARPVRPAGPVVVDAGPNAGARAAYLRVHDGITLELFEPPRAAAADAAGRAVTT